MKEYFQKTLDELIEYSKEVGESEINEKTYWIRKSKKLIIAVLCINWNNKLQFIRGINIEVSLPAGSLCAERNAISSCFTTYLNVKPDHLLCMSVAEFDLEKKQLLPIQPCYVCQSWLHKIWKSSWREKVITIKD